MDKLETLLYKIIGWELTDIIFSNRKHVGEIQKIKVRPVILKERLIFQASQYTKTQVFHKNIEESEIYSWIKEMIQQEFKQTLIRTEDAEYIILSNKKGEVSIKQKQKKTCSKPRDLSHNRQKTYILPEGTPVPFLIDLGVMTTDGKIVRNKYDKYRQINRFLEFIQDVVPELPKDRPITIIDFGCGKSYLTFAMYYYLNILNGFAVNMVGLDLKEDVIRECNRLKDQYGYKDLQFIHGDIADFEDADHVDMVVTLHACDVATDYALYKAVKWNAKIILSVPCCQHELNRKIKNEVLNPVLKYGLLKERMAALVTDGLRGQLLEIMGYKTQILEFIDMEHTPKNILIRAVKTGNVKYQQKYLEDYKKCMDFFDGDLTLYRLMLSELEKEKVSEA